MKISILDDRGVNFFSIIDFTSAQISPPLPLPKGGIAMLDIFNSAIRSIN